LYFAIASPLLSSVMSYLLLWLQYIIDVLYDLEKTVGKSTFSTVSDVVYNIGVFDLTIVSSSVQKVFTSRLISY
jgi:hypothetical protein